MTLSRPDDVLLSVLRPDNVAFRGKRLAELSDQETREGLIQGAAEMSEDTPLLSMDEIEESRRRGVTVSGYPRLIATARAAYDPTGKLWSERAREAEERGRELCDRAANWTDEARAAILAVEDKYGIEVVSSEHNDRWADRCEAAEARCETMRKALLFYADIENWRTVDHLGGPTRIVADVGDRARAALQEQQE